MSCITNHPEKDIKPFPDIGFVRLPTVLSVMPFEKSTLWNKVREGTFPKPIKLGPKITAWRAEDIRQFIQDISSTQEDGGAND